ADYTKAMQINANYAQSYVSRGTAYLRKGEFRKAVDDLRQGLRLDDGQPAARIALGDAYAKLRMYDDARSELDRAVALDSGASEPFLLSARVFEAQGRFDQAAKDYEAALALDPQLDSAKQALAALQAAIKRAETTRLEKPATTGGRLNRVALVIGNG